LKLDCKTGAVIDTKLLYGDILPAHIQYVPANATRAMFGKFLSTTEYFDVYFSFDTEQEYRDYFKESYVEVPTPLGLGSVGLTIRGDEVIRSKRYSY
jgi:hypothetical protein